MPKLIFTSKFINLQKFDSDFRNDDPILEKTNQMFLIYKNSYKKVTDQKKLINTKIWIYNNYWSSL